jgi:hypothetical protein
MQNDAAQQWREIDIRLDGPDPRNPYTDVDAWVTFTHSSGQQLRRPVFWDGGPTYRVRFASTLPGGEWQWQGLLSPAKAIMNGEPSYEHSGRRGVAAGWWQGHEAWCNVCAGALMGVAYGAATLWQWRLHPDEPGHGDYFLVDGVGWREALDFEGSRYVGLVGKILDDLPLTNASPCWDVSSNTRGLLDPRVLYIGYAEHGGPWTFFDADGRVPSKYWLIDPRTGTVLKSGERPPNYVPIEFDQYEPSLLICAETTPAWVLKSE